MAQEHDIQLARLALFSTPLAAARLPDAESLHAALKDIIEAADPGSEHSLGAEAQLSGWSDLDHPEVAQIARQAEAFANQMTYWQGDGMPLWLVRYRTCIIAPGEGLAVHAHPGAAWAASYIVDDGGGGNDPAIGGAMEFQDPRGAAPVMYAPGLRFAVPQGETLGVSQSLQASSGSLIVYPGWLLHGIGLYQGSGTRLSLSFTLELAS